MALLTIRYDLRVPEIAAGSTVGERYSTCLEQCAWADEHGFDSVVLSEHHGVDDGYMSSPLVLAAAVAGRTRRVTISISALLVPLHDPLRLAEDIAALDLVSGGRVAIVLGLGYRQEEFEMFGVDRKRRGKRLEEHVAVMRQAWTGEPFEYLGRPARITPRPLTQPHPMLFIGGSTEIAARRAARLRMPFLPAIGDPELERIYQEECAKQGYGEGFTILPHPLGFVHVADDPERAWAQIAPHALYDAQTYHDWQTPGQRSAVTVEAADADELRRSGVYRVVTPDECVALAEELGPGGSLLFHPLMGGMAPELGWESLELFASKVLPQLRG